MHTCSGKTNPTLDTFIKSYLVHIQTNVYIIETNVYFCSFNNSSEHKLFVLEYAIIR